MEGTDNVRKRLPRSLTLRSGWQGLLKILDNERLRWWASTLAIPVALALVANQYQASENRRAEEAKVHADQLAAEAKKQADERALNERRLTLYTELLSKREEADTAVRRGIFDKVLEKYLHANTGNIENKLVALDLMSANFHDSLDLSPLFWQLDRSVSEGQNTKRRERLLAELARIASEVKLRQLEALEVAGEAKEFNVDLEEQVKPGQLFESKEFDLQFADPLDPKGKVFKRHFSIDVIEPDVQSRRLRVRVAIDKNKLGEERAREVILWADLYDFPLVTFTRISTSERIAVVLRDIKPESNSASLSFIYYPSARSGVKDKPFIDEVISNLVRQPK